MAVTCIFKYQSDTFTCFQKEKWDWRGQSKKKYSGVGGGGSSGLEPGNLEVCGLFW